MTDHPNDRDWDRLDVLVDEDPIALRDAAWRLATALAAAEAELDSWMTRAYEAEGKLWKAEARIRHLEATAQVLVKEVLDAENARDENRRGKAEAEARIKAVQDALDVDEHVTKQMGTLGQWRPDVPAIAHDTIRRALDGV